jgi:hypothetical protein
MPGRPCKLRLGRGAQGHDAAAKGKSSKPRGRGQLDSARGRRPTKGYTEEQTWGEGMAIGCWRQVLRKGVRQEERLWPNN